jgi:hypothetical protein
MAWSLATARDFAEAMKVSNLHLCSIHDVSTPWLVYVQPETVLPATAADPTTLVPSLFDDRGQQIALVHDQARRRQVPP